jgi:tetratricopeptide (TPR) repeat protein
MCRFTIRSLFLAAIFLAAGKPALSQEGNEAGGKAKQLFGKAVEHFKEGKYEDALEEFNECYKTTPHWKIRFNIALCHYQLKNYCPAAEELTRFLEEGGMNIPEKQRTAADGILSELKKKLAILQLSGEIENSIVIIDGKLRHALKKEETIYLQPGSHHVVVDYKGTIILDEEFMIDAGTSREIHTKVVKTSEEQEGKGSAELIATPAGSEELAGGKTKAAILKRNIAYGMVAGAAAAILVGSVMGGLVFKEKKQVKDDEEDYQDPDTPPEDRPGLLKDRDEHYDRGMQYATAADILLPLGGAMAVTGIVLFVISAKEKKSVAGEKKTALSVGPGSFFFSYQF